MFAIRRFSKPPANREPSAAIVVSGITLISTNTAFSFRLVLRCFYMPDLE
jgi:hypothetical protein